MLSREDILQIQQLVRHVVVAEDVARYAVRLSAATRPTQPDVPDFVKKYVKWGAGLRASQALVLGAKARALTLGRAFVTPDDIRTLAAPVFRHRVLINFQAESEGLTTDDVVAKLLERITPPASGLA